MNLQAPLHSSGNYIIICLKRLTLLLCSCFFWHFFSCCYPPFYHHSPNSFHCCPARHWCTRMQEWCSSSPWRWFHASQGLEQREGTLQKETTLEVGALCWDSFQRWCNFLRAAVPGTLLLEGGGEGREAFLQQGKTGQVPPFLTELFFPLCVCLPGWRSLLLLEWFSAAEHPPHSVL